MQYKRRSLRTRPTRHPKPLPTLPPLAPLLEATLHLPIRKTNLPLSHTRLVATNKGRLQDIQAARPTQRLLPPLLATRRPPPVPATLHLLPLVMHHPLLRAIHPLHQTTHRPESTSAITIATTGATEVVSSLDCGVSSLNPRLANFYSSIRPIDNMARTQSHGVKSHEPIHSIISLPVSGSSFLRFRPAFIAVLTLCPPHTESCTSFFFFEFCRC